MNGQPVDTEHSSVGPSSIAYTILCPGRVRMQKGIKDITSFAAAQGTVAHAIGESKLNGKRYPKIGTVKLQDGHKIIVDAEMIEAVKVYINHIKDLTKSTGDLTSYEHIEVKGSLAWLGLPEVFGTADYVLDVPFRTLYIRDYKHGSGVLVDPEYNPQLMTYALIAGQEMFETFDTINMGIVQPRGKDNEKIKVWETDPKEILDWAEDVLRPTVKIALSDDAPLTPGEKQCQWCRAEGICPALAETALQTAQEDFKDFANIQPNKIVSTTPIEKIIKAYEQLPLLKQFIKAVEARVFDELSAGQNIPGYKLVKGRRSRKWTDTNLAAQFLEERDIDPFEHILLTPAKAEKALGKAKKECKHLISVSDGKPSIVPENDKREAITTAQIDFNEFKKD